MHVTKICKKWPFCSIALSYKQQTEPRVNNITEFIHMYICYKIDTLTKDKLGNIKKRNKYTVLAQIGRGNT